MYGEDWINIFKRVIRILKVKWWVYNKHCKSKIATSRPEEMVQKDINKPDYVSYVDIMEKLGWKS